MSFEVKNITIEADGKDIVTDVSFRVEKGELCLLLGPNGSGKSTLANTLAAHPKYLLKSGTLELDGEDITNASADVRAKKGLFLSMQHPPAIPGVSVANFLRVSYNALHNTEKNPFEFHQELLSHCKELQIDTDILSRELHVGFSGGEKKKLEMLQLRALKPRYAVLDEIDSGLDVDALAQTAKLIESLVSSGVGVLLISHSEKMLDLLSPSKVLVMKEGRIEKQGDATLAKRVYSSGFQV